MNDTSVVQIDLSAVEHNMRVIRRLTGEGTLLCPIVKADAYGLGAVRIGRKLLSAGARMLAVYTPDQAIELFKGTPGGSVLILMPVREMGRTHELYRPLVEGRLQLTVHDAEHLDDVLRLAEQFGAIIPVQVEIDTGMGRGGAPPTQITEILTRIASNRWLRLAGIFTHFARAEGDQAATDAQLARFDELIEANGSLIPGDCLIHVANSFAMLRHARYHKRMVRIGLAWAGYGVESLEGGEILAGADQLRPAVTWRSRIVHLKSIPAGQSVGYGSRWTARRASRIALVPVGYADGYPAVLGSAKRRPGAPVRVAVDEHESATPVYAPVVGAVNMDQITIDVTDLPADRIRVGVAVELISPEVAAPNHLPRLAQRADTIPHDLLTGLNPRLRRSYVINMPEASTVTRAVPAMV